MLVEFSIIPVGVGSSIGEVVAKVLKIIAESGIRYKATSMGTIVEGDWDEVMTLIKKCHNTVVETSGRAMTRIAIDDRKGAQADRLEGKITSVEKRLGLTLNK
ncbi:MAG: hypothetical protein A2Y62_20915 [Candidatus Fischerbacteria bacterium RBG_13_37_8]|uniref:Thiamine-binding protein domain-containing protein n=1 Tax=Candidatus Fischerbacteria bacterium RBG_13_37_8 TaxID=1817863 RepID=A0A1F5VEW3_9BACT|nr:MAG: hypothetical protein A2Y62_20915 [Candidatus Fischerbacteria bacterium RBG_13_37_8]